MVGKVCVIGGGPSGLGVLCWFAKLKREGKVRIRKTLMNFSLYLSLYQLLCISLCISPYAFPTVFVFFLLALMYFYQYLSLYLSCQFFKLIKEIGQMRIWKTQHGYKSVTHSSFLICILNGKRIMSFRKLSVSSLPHLNPKRFSSSNFWIGLG